MRGALSERTRLKESLNLIGKEELLIKRELNRGQKA